jgi:hypothetical protein
MPGWLELATLIGLIAIGGYWLDALRSQEQARAAGRRACDHAGVQFLDDSVVLTRVRLKRDARGALAFWREYRFEFSIDGAGRHPGHVILHGQRMIEMELDMGEVRRLH